MTRLVMLLISFSTVAMAAGQAITLKGTVTDRKKQPVAQAHVRVDGGLGEATTDNAGHFHLQLSQMVKADQTITLRCEDPKFRLFTADIQASTNLIIEITLVRKKIPTKPVTHSRQFPHHPDSILVNVVTFQDTSPAGLPLSETFAVPTESRHNMPEKNVSIPYTLKDPNGIITKIERSCTSPDNNNRCRLNYMLHVPGNDPERFGDFALNNGGTPEYLPDCHLNASRNGFVYYRKWVGGECTEVYTIFYKVPVITKEKRPK